jgi:endonuclease-3 related protein
MSVSIELITIYKKALEHFGPRGWWPGDTDFEICVGAILTQSVSWKNVSKAITCLKTNGLLDIWEMHVCENETLEKCIIPTMYYRMKARKLKAFVKHIIEKYDGNLQKMWDKEMQLLRTELLNIYGIGPETADSIILYASRKAIFVVDAYTKRIFVRLGYFDETVSYEQMQQFFMQNLPIEEQLFNEYHALIVGVGNNFCSSKVPKCNVCPLNSIGCNK